MAEEKKEERTIEVRIQAHERVRYDQTVKMTPSDAEQLKKLYEAACNGSFKEEQKLNQWIDDWIDRRDVEDADDLEDVEVTFPDDD